MEFELTNEQRKYFGLDPVEKKWDKIQLNENTWIYFEGNTIKKVMSIFPGSSYSENDYNLKTDKRKTLLPKTPKGKKKPLTPSNILAFQAINFSFSASVDRRDEMKKSIHKATMRVYNQTTRKNITVDYDENIKNFDELSRWIKQFIATSPPGYLEEITRFKKSKRVNVKYKSGDIFTFPINRTTYGFGKILFPLKLLKDKKILKPHHYFTWVMRVPLLVRLYAFKAETQHIDIQTLQKEKLLPAYFMMDDDIFWGDYPIIGSSPLQEEELDFPLSYSVQGNILSWGLGTVNNLPPIKTNINPYTTGITMENTGAVCGANTGLLEKYFKGEEPYYEYDLAHSKNKKLRAEIFRSAGLSPDITYDEFCKKTDAPNRKQLIEMLHGF